MSAGEALIKPGEIRNPRGKSKGSKSFKNALRKVLEADCVEIRLSVNGKTTEEQKIKIENTGCSIYDAIAAVQVQQAIKGDHRAVKDIIDRMEGSASQSIKMDSHTTGSLSVKIERRIITSKADLKKTVKTTIETTEHGFDIDEVF